MIVVDSNVLAHLYLPGEFTAAAETPMERDPDWSAPVSWRSEFRNILAKIRLYPSSAQQDIIARQLGCVRFVWNKALSLKKAAWAERHESLSLHTLITMLPVWKAGDYPWLKDADSQALQMTLRPLDRAYMNFFAHRARFPRFKKRHASRQALLASHAAPNC